MTTTLKYKWANPREWLLQQVQQKARSNDVAWLRNVCVNLIGMADADDIQDVFRGEMEQDGYFTPTRT